MACLSRPYSFKFFKRCLPQILLSPFLNTLSQILFKFYSQTVVVNFEHHFPNNFFRKHGELQLFSYRLLLALKKTSYYNHILRQIMCMVAHYYYFKAKF